MATMRATCPACKKAFGILERQLGAEVYCPHCGQKMKTQAPATSGQSLQDAAAAQLFGPADRSADSGFSTSASPEVSAAADALQAAAGGKPPSRPPPRERTVPTASAAPPPGSDTRLAHHLGLDQRHEQPSSLASAPVRSTSVLSVWGVIIFLALAGLIGGAVYQYSNLKRERAQAHKEELERQKRPRHIGVIRPMSQEEQLAPSDVEEVDARRVDPDEIPPPMTVHPILPPVYHATPEQREVLFGTVKPLGGRAVRRARLNIQAIGKESDKRYGEASILFCDVKPDEEVYFAFEYPFVSEKGTKWAHEVLEDVTQRPEYEFDMLVRRIIPDGQKSGVIHCDVTNKMPYRAMVVDVTLIFFNPYGQPAGYTKGQVVNLGPGETQEAKIRWENWDREDIREVKARAQIGGED